MPRLLLRLRWRCGSGGCHSRQEMGSCFPRSAGDLLAVAQPVDGSLYTMHAPFPCLVGMPQTPLPGKLYEMLLGAAASTCAIQQALAQCTGCRTLKRAA